MNKKFPAITNTKKHRNRSEGGDFFENQPAYLNLSDGVRFSGVAPAWQVGTYTGEVVFNTGMTGYVESLTDPSYTGQILVFTYPLIGNYGIRTASAESEAIQVSGVVVSEAALGWSHLQSDRSLLDWLRAQNIPILMGVDTRALTKHLRVKGTMVGSISDKRTRLHDLKLSPAFVSIDEPITYNAKRSKKVILVDCGAKENILRSLIKLGVQVKRVPCDYDYTKEEYDGVLLSNGPGDPTDYKETIEIARRAMDKNKPIFGICLGSQIMGLAAGANTYKLKYGHRGHNQPCLEEAAGRCYITSQNHGYAIDAKSLPKDWAVTFRNLNDGSVEGVKHQTKPFFAVQFHPEACPGPTDTAWLFDRFFQLL